MANLILPRTPLVSYDFINYFMTAPAGGITIPAATATEIGPGDEEYNWVDDTDTTITTFAIDPSIPVFGHQFGYELYVDGQKQQEGLVTNLTNTLVTLTSETAATIAAGAQITLTIVDFSVA